MKTLLKQYIEQAREKFYQQTETSWFDAGVRDVYFEGFLAGLEKAQRLVNKQKRIEEKAS